MNKKINIGSIIAVAILIGVSFTSVVGYNSVASDVKASPLFNIRSSRAIDEESEELWCEYVGKGDGNTLSIPTRDGRTVLIQKLIDRISKMDDEAFDKFVNLVVNKIQKYDEFKDLRNDDVIISLNKLRNHQELIVTNNSDIKEIYTVGFEFIPTLCWFPECVPLAIMVGLILFGLLILFSPIIIYAVWCYNLFYSGIWGCTYYDCPPITLKKFS